MPMARYGELSQDFIVVSDGAVHASNPEPEKAPGAGVTGAASALLSRTSPVPAAVSRATAAAMRRGLFHLAMEPLVKRSMICPRSRMLRWYVYTPHPRPSPPRQQVVMKSG